MLNKEIYIIYGNHGKDPTQINDYFDLFREILEEMELPVRFEENIVPNAHNVLIECFLDKHVPEIEKIKKDHPDTRLACLCTEFINGQTFNFFEEESDLKSTSVISKRKFKFGLIALLPTFIKEIIKKLLPSRYVHKQIIIRVFDIRFRNFKRILPLLDVLWCVTEFQLPEYKKRFPDKKICYFPSVTFRKSVRIPFRASDKDIDILFSGTMTQEREEKLNRLRKLGLRVVAGLWSDILRDSYLKRTKICLQIKQNPRWKYPSVMRLHYLLTSGCLVLAEKCELGCIQENVVTLFEGDELTTKAVELVKKKNLESEVNLNFNKYLELLKEDQNLVIQNITDFLGNKTTK